MALQVEQLIYTSFPDQGFKGLAGPQLPSHIHHRFVDSVVHQYWDAYSPPSIGYRAVYLHQLSPQDCLFGWLYSDGLDEMGRDGVPYFLCYYLLHELNSDVLNLIIDCLERGPIKRVERQYIPSALEPLMIPDPCHYVPAQPGVVVPSAMRARCRLLLDKAEPLDFCIQFEPDSQAGQRATEDIKVPLLGESNLQKDVAVDVSLTAGPATKVALLIGVSEYGAGLQPYPKSVNDLEALRQVLDSPEQGGFTEVQTLLNPDPQVMAEAIEALFLDRNPEDLVLLYFSGYVGLLDSQGKIGLTTGVSRRGTNGFVVRSTVITADFLNDVMEDSLAQQTLILDWCVSEEEQSLGTTKRVVNFAPQITGPNRTVFMSSASTQSTVVTSTMDCSAYTFFLVEGMKTGAADLNCDGDISLTEWHRYAKQRLQQVSPALDPKMFGTPAKMRVACSPLHDPSFKYRRQVEVCSDQAQVSAANRVVLNTLYQTLGLSLEEAAVIEAEVFRPHRDYQDKLQDYAIAFTQAIEQGYPLPLEIYRRFKQFQYQLGLTNADIVPIESELLRRLDVLKSPAGISTLATVSQVSRSAQAQQYLGKLLDQGHRYIRPLSSWVITSTRHSLARCKQACSQWPDLGLSSARRLRPSSIVFLCLGVGLGTAVLMVVLNQQQVANRKQRVSTIVPKAKGALSILQQTQTWR